MPWVVSGVAAPSWPRPRAAQTEQRQGRTGQVPGYPFPWQPAARPFDWPGGAGSGSECSGFVAAAIGGGGGMGGNVQ